MFKYQLTESQTNQVALMSEFANGATQVHVRLRDERVFPEVLISNSMWIVAIRGFDDLPFKPEDIAGIYQTEDDKNPTVRGGWKYWDDWK
jgi:hypothetical protein